MYTELKEMVHFVATFARTKLPKRRMALFTEHLANGMLARYCSTWNSDSPTLGASERALRINTAAGTSQLLTTVATSLFIDVQYLLSAFPMEMVVYWNAGEVFYHLGDTPTRLPIWSGDINSDSFYSPIPARISAVEMTPANNTGRAALQAVNATASSAKKTELDCTCLAVVPWDHHSDFYWNKDIFLPGSVPSMVFRYAAVPNTAFTTTSFAVTRFGSRRSQPDHNALKRIQHAAERMSLSDSSTHATANIAARREVTRNGQLVYPSNAGLVAMMGQASRGVAMPINTHIRNAYEANGNAAGAYAMAQHQQPSRFGATSSAMRPTTQFNNNNYAMGDVAFLNYFTASKPNNRSASRSAQLGGGDGHSTMDALPRMRGLPVAYVPPNLIHNAVGDLVYGMASGGMVPSEDNHSSAVNPRDRILRLIAQGAGDGHSTESRHNYGTARPQTRRGFSTQETFVAAGTAPVGSHGQLRTLGRARQGGAFNTLNGVEEVSGPSNGAAISDGTLSGMANKWNGMA